MKAKIILLTFFSFFLFSACSSDSQYDEFATCLSDQGAIMYGTSWCPHCQDQKAMFGSSFDNINYVDCDLERSKCEEAGVQGYPTWVLKDGKKLVGTQDLSDLADATSCTLSK